MLQKVHEAVTQKNILGASIHLIFRKVAALIEMIMASKTASLLDFLRDCQGMPDQVMIG